MTQTERFRTIIRVGAAESRHDGTRTPPGAHRPGRRARRPGLPARRVVALLLLLLVPAAGRAQALTRPALRWETIRTAHFDIHFPAEMRAWAAHVASRIESETEAVVRLVGSRPTRRVTIMIEDPSSVSNGFAIPFMEGPLIFLWPTPPTPTPSFGEYRDWGEILAVHEYGHIAHLTFEPRNPRDRLFWRFMPVSIGPVPRKSPSWVIEGYATLIEGRLTGNGRPNGAGRPAIIRQWAREGKLPTYGGLDATSPFLGGAMRYLVGSAFLEWLERRKGPESLNHLWRRMSARVNRSFDEAFAGVFGAPPADLYGRFVAEATANAMAVERQIVATGPREGELFQRMSWSTGEPAVSPDGSKLAVVVRSPREPSRLVVWSTAPVADTARARRRRELLARDSLDVPAFDSFPPPRRALATLKAVNGRAHDFPRFLADGERVLVSRDEPRGDGTTRPDLFLWDTRTGALARVTHGASIRQADPAPDGRSAVAVRCRAGICDLVRVDLARGSLAPLAHGSPTLVWHRPRWSPDGRRVAASRHREGRWEVVIVDVARGDTVGSRVGPADAAERYAPEWEADGRSLVVVSERGGVANLARIDAASGTESEITRVVGAAMAPTVDRADTAAYFLSLHAKGYDVRRIALRSVTPGAPVALDPALFPVTPAAPSNGEAFARDTFAGPRPYGLGPRRWRVLPGGAAAAEGGFVTLAVANTDPAGRLGALAQGAWGDAGSWRGASLRATLRRWPVHLEGDLFATRHAPSTRFGPPLALPTLDARYDGGSAALSLGRDWLSRWLSLRAGFSYGSLESATLGSDARRRLGFAELGAGAVRARGRDYISGSLSGHVTGGRTDGGGWTRGIASVSLGAGLGAFAVRGQGTIGAVRHDVGQVPALATGTLVEEDRTPAYEDFAVGGVRPPLFDEALLSQRVALPAVPVGYAFGRRVEMLRVSAPRLPLVALPLSPYATWVRAGRSFGGAWRRVVGAETTMDFESLAFASLPGVRIDGGVGYALDEPFRRKVRGYLSLTYRP